MTQKVKVISFDPLVVELPQQHQEEEQWLVELPPLRLTLIDLGLGVRVESEAPVLSIKMDFPEPAGPGKVIDGVSAGLEKLVEMHKAAQEQCDEMGALNNLNKWNK